MSIYIIEKLIVKVRGNEDDDTRVDNQRFEFRLRSKPKSFGYGISKRGNRRNPQRAYLVSIGQNSR